MDTTKATVEQLQKAKTELEKALGVLNNKNTPHNLSDAQLKAITEKAAALLDINGIC